jgi:hypothetical protein
VEFISSSNSCFKHALMSSGGLNQNAVDAVDTAHGSAGVHSLDVCTCIATLVSICI